MAYPASLKYTKDHEWVELSGDRGKVGITGDATQPRDKGGWAKAMIHVNADGTIARAYNAVTGASGPGAGFSFFARDRDTWRLWASRRVRSNLARSRCFALPPSAARWAGRGS